MNKKYLLVFVLVLGGFRIQAQTLTPDSLLRILPDRFPEERVYLHLDKDKYMGGDTIWFKAYLFSGIFPGEVSTGLHVELFDAAGSRILQRYFPVLGGRLALGQMELKDSLPSGPYTVRAYTDWMGNFDPAFFYHFTFPLYATGPGVAKAKMPGGKTGAAAPASAATSGQAPSSVATSGQAPSSVATSGQAPASGGTAVSVAPAEDIQFLPEGGDAVQNVFTMMAFRATDRNGLPLDIEGKIVDDQDSLITEFKATHDGMGVFPYTPWQGRTFTAIVETPAGQRRIALPTPKADGVVLNARRLGKGVGFVLRADTASRYLNQPLEVIGSMYGHMVFKAKARLNADMPESSDLIPFDKFVTGILTITVFSPSGVPLAERAMFIRPRDIRISASLSTDTLNIVPKGLNAWNLHFPDTSRGYFSVSVTDADALASGDGGGNILTGLLLGGDLKGNIYHPAWYFRDDTDSTQSALDLVMLTHGWRRYDWEALEQGQFPSIRQPGKSYLSFEGQAFTESGKKTVNNTLLTVFLRGSDSTKKLLLLSLDSTGHFFVDNLLFFDTATAYFQVNKKGYAAKNVQLQLRPLPYFPFDPQHLKGVIQPGQAEDSAFVGNGNRQAELLSGLRRLTREKEMREVIIKGHKRTAMEEMDDRYTSGLFAEGNGHFFDMVNDNKQASSYFDILSYLQARVPGLQISGSYPSLSVRYRGGTPDFFVDEMSTTMDMIESIPVSDIAYVKVFEPPFVGSFGGGPHGAVAIYTRRGGDQTANIQGLNRLTLTGFSSARQNYVPVYEAHDTAAGARPDYRMTLAWQPLLFTDAQNRTLNVRFYNNDNCRHFRIVVEGMDENGKLLHLEEVVGAGDGKGMKNP